MAEIVATAAIEILLEKMLTLSAEQMGLVLNFKDDLKKLQKTISMVNGFLHDAKEKQVAAQGVKIWLRELEALVFEADNVFDEVIYRLLSKKVRASKKEKVKSCFSCSSKNPFAYRLKLGHKIKDINERLTSINRQARDLGLQEAAAQQAPAVYASETTQTDSVSEDPIFHGRTEEVSSVVRTLITSTEPKLSVLPIVGMGGLGKTTLVRKVFNHEQIISHFGDKQRVWVHVPTKFDEVVLLERILTSMGTGSHVSQGNREALVQMLQQHLGAKKYLLVLDDVWNEDTEKWDGFVNSLSGISSATGNCVLVTTRKLEVASIVKTLPVHELKGLSNEDCWSIIHAKAFIGAGDVTSELEEIGINIAEKCQGLPLAAKVVGGLLRNKSKDDWMSIKEDWIPGVDENHITKILKLSFDNLSSPSLKKCFAYCSIFPKGYEIKKEQLIELWMAEGFVQTDPQRSNVDMETTGNKIFNILRQNSLLQVTRSDDNGNATHCNMHDLVHDLAFSILHENDNIMDGVCQGRYIGHKSNGDGLLSVAKGQERYVRTLFFDGKISEIKFSEFESLRTLTLVSVENVDVLPTSIRKLKHLRYLAISETRIKYLPDSIGELYHLQTIRAKKDYLEKLPDSLSCLISLRHLHISEDTTLPPEIGKLTSLQTLRCFLVGSKKGYRISELGSLKNLKGELGILNLENVRDKNEAMSGGLSQKSDIYELALVWDESREGDNKANDDESVFEGLQPHPNLKSLGIGGFKGKSLSLWEGVNNLVEIKLTMFSECEELPMLGHLPHLKYLGLDGLTKVTSIRYSFYGNIDNCRRETIVLFPSLERLELENMSNLKEWDEAVDFPSPTSRVFPRLKYLKVVKCKQLTRAPSHFPCLEELEIDGMERGLALENICGIKLTSLTNLNIEEIEGLVCLPDWLFSNNHNLTKLKIRHCRKMTHLVPHLGGGGGAPSLLRELWFWDCPNLRELPDDLHSLNSLEKLVIYECPDLKSIPYCPISNGGGGQQQQQQGFTSLRELAIVSCSGLTHLPIEMVESCAKSLESLQLMLESSVAPQNLIMVIGCLHKMPRLRDLGITEGPNFRCDGRFGSLSLRVGPFSDCNNASFNEAVGAIMLPQLVGSFRRLTLHGKEDWDSLPDQLKHLTSLEYLYIEDFGMEALHEWFGNLSSLKTLTLENCKKLRHLPSKQAMQRLSKLTFLDITNCPLLLNQENRSNNDDDDELPQIVDSEWPNISHIRYVHVDGRQISSNE